MSRAALVSLLIGTVAVVAGCAADSAEGVDTGDNALVHRARDLWIYDGPLPTLESPEVTISLRGHTARVSGLLPAGAAAPTLPHVKAKDEKGRLRIDAVYPIATGAEGGFNAKPGDYTFTRARPYRPDGMTTSTSGTSYVTWGGFPFLAYAGNVALHGPISRQEAANRTELFYLQRGRVSHGCNRMNGEHVTEVAHLVGVSMRKVWGADAIYENPSTANATVKVIADYDTYGGKPVDVDYPTADPTANSGPPVERPKDSVMFGSWIGTESPDGSDLPADMKWEAGISGKPYVFKAHAIPNMICSVPEARVKALRAWADTLPNKEVPKGFCAKKECILDALKNGGEPKAACGL